MLPTFLVIGAQKAGTTSLYNYLGRHPDVFVSAQKELNFFTDAEFGRGLGWYEAQFADAGSARARGEVSPFYTSYPWQPSVPERAAQVVPGARLVYLLRHPIERCLSNYRHHVALGVESRPVEEAVFGDTWQYLDRSRYAMQLDRWLACYDRSAILLVTSEALRADPAATLARVFVHLDVDPAAPLASQDAVALNAGAGYRADRWVAARLRSSSTLWPAVRGVVPQRARRALWRVAGSRPLAPEVRDVRLSDRWWEHAVEALRPDLERLRTYMPPDFDAWGLLD